VYGARRLAEDGHRFGRHCSCKHSVAASLDKRAARNDARAREHALALARNGPPHRLLFARSARHLADERRFDGRGLQCTRNRAAPLD
jgi:hypothetical protein